MKKMQKRVIKMIKGIEHLPYEPRLEHVGLFRLQNRQRKGDMTEVYTKIHGVEKMNRENLFSLCHSARTRLY